MNALAGLGIGWRPEIADIVAGLDVAFCEVVAEAMPCAAVPEELGRIRARGIPVVPHGVTLSLGGADPLDMGRVEHLAACAELLGAPLVSEHVAFVRADGIEAGHLLPVPRTEAALNVLARNIRAVQSVLPVPLAVENIAALFDWPRAEYSEDEFLAELVDRTGVGLILDVANVYANSRNRGRDPVADLESMPLEAIAYCHVAGGSEFDGAYHDTHTDPVPDAVLDLVTALRSRVPAPMMLERDGNYPAPDVLRAELDAIAAAGGFERVTR